MTAPPPTAPSNGGGLAILSGALRTLTQRLFDTRGGAYPALGRDSSPDAKRDYVQRLLDEGEMDALLRYKRGTQALLFADGRQHIDWTMRDKVWADTAIPNGRLYVTMNYIRPILRSRMQRMMSAELQWRAIPRGNDYESRDKATTAANFLKARWEKCQMDAKVRQGLWMSFNATLAMLKTFWNPTIGNMTAATMMLRHPTTGALTEYPVDRTGQPLMNEQGDPAPDDSAGVFRYRPGDVDTALRSIFNVRINPDAWGFEPDEGMRWLLDSDLVPLAVIKERYGDRAKDVSALSGNAAAKNYERIIKSLSATLGVTPTGGDVAASRGQQADKDSTLLTEYWEAPSDYLPEGRLLVIAGGKLIYPHDGDPEGLPDGFVPVVPLYDERRPFDWSGRGTSEDLIQPQKVINRQWEAELEEQMRHGVGQWIMWGVPGLSNQITNMSGAHIEIPTTSALANKPIGDVVQRVPPPGFNPARWRLIAEAKATMFDIGAFHEIQRGQVPPGVDSGIAVQYLEEAENAQLHDPVRNLKRSLITWGRHQLKVARRKYGEEEERWIPVHRPDLGFMVEAVRGLDLPDPDDVDIDLEGFRPTSQAAMRAELLDLMKTFPDQVPVREGMLAMDLGRGVEGMFETQTRHYARARRENLRCERGEVLTQPIKQADPANPTAPADPLASIPTAGLGYAMLYQDKTPLLLPSDDDHQTHIRVHQDVALDDTQAWPIRQAILQHIAEHRTMLAQQSAKPPREPAVSVTVKGTPLDPNQTREVLASEGINVQPLDPVAAKVGAAAHEPPPPPDAGDKGDGGAKGGGAGDGKAGAAAAPSEPSADVKALIEEMRADRADRQAERSKPAAAESKDRTVHVHLTKGGKE